MCQYLLLFVSCFLNYNNTFVFLFVQYIGKLYFIVIYNQMGKMKLITENNYTHAESTILRDHDQQTALCNQHSCGYSLY